MPKRRKRQHPQKQRTGPKRAIIYCRVSTPEQVKNHSLGTQEQQCLDYCRREGWEVLQILHEGGESAQTANRTEFQRAIETCQSRRDRVDFLVVADVSRYMRNTEDHFTVRSQLAAAGVMLRCATQRIDETPEGRLFETIAAGFAEYDNNKRRQKTVAGMIACLAKRRWPFQAPLGYLKIRAADGHPNLAPHPQLAAHIRRAFERAAAGCSRRTILAELRASVDS